MRSKPPTNMRPSRNDRLAVQEATYGVLNPTASMPFGFSSGDPKPPSYGACPESTPMINKSDSYDLSSSSGDSSSSDLHMDNHKPRHAVRNENFIKIQQPSMNPPPLPPSRRRAFSAEKHENYQRSGSGEHELDALSPRSSSGNGYPYNNFAAPPKAPPRPQQSPRAQSPRPPFNRSNSTHSADHRRTHSFDVPQRKLRRGSSSGSLVSVNSHGSGYSQPTNESLKLLPDPRWGGGSGGRTNRARTMSGSSYERGHRKMDSISSSDGLLFNNGGGGFGQHPLQYGSVPSASKDVIMNGFSNPFPLEQSSSGGHHRRTPSEVSTASFMSAVSVDTSIEPARVDPAKSSMFKEVASGLVRLQLPKDNFRLLSDRDLESGHVYKRQLVENEDVYFQDFHTTEESEFPIQSVTGCNCHCDNCNHCHSRRKTLPPTFYVMSVKSDIYRRMFDEVSESRSMPCGLFFCGHHEDVRYPSIMIAVVIVAALFAALLVATIYFED